jgi:small subunit ribosomal protein S14
MPPRPNVRVLRDIKARQGVADNEISRRAYLYVARNQTLPAQVRYQAQLQLNAFGRYTRPTTVKNRCTATGRGRGVMGEFGLCRVRERMFELEVLFLLVLALPDRLTGGGLQYQFRLKALAGEIPGVHKASW